MQWSSHQLITSNNLKCRYRLKQEPTIEIWKANLEIAPELENQYWAILNTEEKQRASRFVKPEDKRRFIAGRGILRSLLGNYLNLTPASIKFDYLPHGKPILAENNCSPPLQFNVSHSHHLGLYALTYFHYGIGIDLEFLRPLPEALSLAQRFFTKKEAAYLASFPLQRQQAMFFRLWTAKEAYLKATGEGLIGLQKIEIAASATTDNQFKVIKGQRHSQLHVFQPEQTFIATVASLENHPVNQGKVENHTSYAESQENKLVFRNWENNQD